nr:zinc knuckle CX2CX4HX4C [Tanacetum cinerariifolium]
MKTILYPKRIALLLVILILDDHVIQARSGSFESPLRDIYFRRSRMLRKLPKPPPAPKLSQSPHYKFVYPPPPPPSLPMRATYPSFRNDVNVIKEDVCNIYVWLKFHDVPITDFMKDGLSAITTKLANVELRDTIIDIVPKFSGGGFTTSTIHVEYECEPPRCLGCKEHGKPLEMKVTNEASASKPVTSMEEQLVKFDEDEVELSNDETSRYISSTGGGGFFEDALDCYDGYEAKVYDLPQ